MAEQRYVCEVCRKSFYSDWVDEDAKAERRFNFGEERNLDDAVVCDDCYAEIMHALGARAWPPT